MGNFLLQNAHAGDAFRKRALRKKPPCGRRVCSRTINTFLVGLYGLFAIKVPVYAVTTETTKH